MICKHLQVLCMSIAHCWLTKEALGSRSWLTHFPMFSTFYFSWPFILQQKAFIVLSKHFLRNSHENKQTTTILNNWPSLAICFCALPRPFFKHSHPAKTYKTIPRPFYQFIISFYTRLLQSTQECENLAKGIVSLMLSIPKTHCRYLSKPIPKPPWGTEPNSLSWRYL